MGKTRINIDKPWILDDFRDTETLALEERNVWHGCFVRPFATWTATLGPEYLDIKI